MAIQRVLKRDDLPRETELPKQPPHEFNELEPCHARWHPFFLLSIVNCGTAQREEIYLEKASILNAIKTMLYSACLRGSSVLAISCFRFVQWKEARVDRNLVWSTSRAVLVLFAVDRFNYIELYYVVNWDSVSWEGYLYLISLALLLKLRWEVNGWAELGQSINHVEKFSLGDDGNQRSFALNWSMYVTRATASWEKIFRTKKKSYEINI